MDSIQEMFSEETWRSNYHPEALRTRGEIRIKLAQSDAADADFREAIALSKKMDEGVVSANKCGFYAKGVVVRGEHYWDAVGQLGPPE